MARIDFDTKNLANKISAKGAQLVRKIILDGMRQLIRQSPVDTGRFKAAWSTSINAMSTGEKPMLGRKTPLKKLSSIADYQASTQHIKNYKLGQTAYLHNNLEYGVALEYGTPGSKQAPKGWIRNESIKMQNKLNKINGLI